MASFDLPHHTGHIMVMCPPDVAYDLVADVQRMGELSPVCNECWWDAGDDAREGAWFTGRNELDGRTWETRCQIAVANRGQEFTFVVGGIANGTARWSYSFEPIAQGTRVAESWEILPEWLSRLRSRTEDDEEIQRTITDRVATAHTGIAATLAAIKRAAETV
jgi:hypothetical protein